MFVNISHFGLGFGLLKKFKTKILKQLNGMPWPLIGRVKEKKV